MHDVKIKSTLRAIALTFGARPRLFLNVNRYSEMLRSTPLLTFQFFTDPVMRSAMRACFGTAAELHLTHLSQFGFDAATRTTMTHQFGALTSDESTYMGGFLQFSSSVYAQSVSDCFNVTLVQWMNEALAQGKSLAGALSEWSKLNFIEFNKDSAMVAARVFSLLLLSSVVVCTLRKLPRVFTVMQLRWVSENAHIAVAEMLSTLGLPPSLCAAVNADLLPPASGDAGGMVNALRGELKGSVTGHAAQSFNISEPITSAMATTLRAWLTLTTAMAAKGSAATTNRYADNRAVALRDLALICVRDRWRRVCPGDVTRVEQLDALGRLSTWAERYLPPDDVSSKRKGRNMPLRQALHAVVIYFYCLVDTAVRVPLASVNADDYDAAVVVAEAPRMQMFAYSGAPEWQEASTYRDDGAVSNADSDGADAVPGPAAEPESALPDLSHVLHTAEKCDIAVINLGLVPACHPLFCAGFTQVPWSEDAIRHQLPDPHCGPSTHGRVTTENSRAPWVLSARRAALSTVPSYLRLPPSYNSHPAGIRLGDANSMLHLVHQAEQQLCDAARGAVLLVLSPHDNLAWWLRTLQQDGYVCTVLLVEQPCALGQDLRDDDDQPELSLKCMQADAFAVFSPDCLASYPYAVPVVFVQRQAAFHDALRNNLAQELPLAAALSQRKLWRLLVEPSDGVTCFLASRGAGSAFVPVIAINPYALPTKLWMSILRLAAANTSPRPLGCLRVLEIGPDGQCAQAAKHLGVAAYMGAAYVSSRAPWSGLRHKGIVDCERSPGMEGEWKDLVELLLRKNTRAAAKAATSIDGIHDMLNGLDRSCKSMAAVELNMLIDVQE